MASSESTSSLSSCAEAYEFAEEGASSEPTCEDAEDGTERVGDVEPGDAVKGGGAGEAGSVGEGGDDSSWCCMDWVWDLYDIAEAARGAGGVAANVTGEDGRYEAGRGRICVGRAFESSQSLRSMIFHVRSIREVNHWSVETASGSATATRTDPTWTIPSRHATGKSLFCFDGRTASILGVGTMFLFDVGDGLAGLDGVDEGRGGTMRDRVGALALKGRSILVLVDV